MLLILHHSGFGPSATKLYQDWAGFSCCGIRALTNIWFGIIRIRRRWGSFGLTFIWSLHTADNLSSTMPGVTSGIPNTSIEPCRPCCSSSSRRNSMPHTLLWRLEMAMSFACNSCCRDDIMELAWFRASMMGNTTGDIIFWNFSTTPLLSSASLICNKYDMSHLLGDSLSIAILRSSEADDRNLHLQLLMQNNTAELNPCCVTGLWSKTKNPSILDQHCHQIFSIYTGLKYTISWNIWGSVTHPSAGSFLTGNSF